MFGASGFLEKFCTRFLSGFYTSLWSLGIFGFLEGRFKMFRETLKTSLEGFGRLGFPQTPFVGSFFLHEDRFFVVLRVP